MPKPAPSEKNTAKWGMSGLAGRVLLVDWEHRALLTRLNPLSRQGFA
jgi:hypothetical protein